MRTLAAILFIGIITVGLLACGSETTAPTNTAVPAAPAQAADTPTPAPTATTAPAETPTAPPGAYRHARTRGHAYLCPRTGRLCRNRSLRLCRSRRLLLNRHPRRNQRRRRSQNCPSQLNWRPWATTCYGWRISTTGRRACRPTTPAGTFSPEMALPPGMESAGRLGSWATDGTGIRKNILLLGGSRSNPRNRRPNTGIL